MAANPTNVAAALELIRRGDFRSAVAFLEQASRDAPDDAHARFLLGASHHGLGQLHEALRAFDAALALAPGHLEAGQAAVAVLCQLGRPRAALERCERLLALAPDDPRVHFNTALAQEAAGEPEAALAHYDAVLALHARMRDAWLNRGTLLLRLGRHAAALENNRALVAAFPDDAEARFNLAEACLARSLYDEALAQCDHALTLAPQAPDVHFDRGLALAALGAIDEAEAAFGAARRLDPARFAAREASVQRGGTEALDARAVYLARGFEALDSCDWADRDRYLQRFAGWIREDGANPLDAPALVFRAAASGLAPELQRRLAVQASARIARTATPFPPADPARPSGRIRIGYVSADFRAHAVGWLTEDLYARHDRTRFEVFAYALTAGDGSRVRSRIAAAVDLFRDVSRDSAGAVAAQIRADAVEVLVDLTGYTLEARPEAFAMRPAPVNVAYLGYPGTSGAPFIDYLIADRVAVPPSAARHFTERLVCLPDTLWCYGRPASPPNERPARESLGLPPSGFVFAALHNAYKIRPEIFACWMALLTRVPGSVLWVLARREEVRENLQREAARCGVDPGRLVFAPPVPRDAHFARQPAADLFLDTLEYSSGATCLDALWSGLPVLACPSGSYAGRQSASALGALGLDDLIATGLDDYLERATRLATDARALADVRARLAIARGTMPLFDMDARVRELEAAFNAMAGRWRAGLPPAPMAIDRGGASARILPAEA